ncbi:MAG: AMIN domain-containing protein [Candidatus Sulfotelmatobacter sp.]
MSVPVLAQAQAVTSVRSVQLLGNKNPLEIEIEASDRLAPQAQVLTGPDRLVVDFPNAVPATQLHNQAWHHGDVKSVRVSLFSAKPPVTRVVFDLNGPQPYQVFPSGRTVIVKVGAAGQQNATSNPSSSVPSGPKLVSSNYPLHSVEIELPPTPPLVVSFKAGLLTISANKASLSDVLAAVQKRTGANIELAPGADQEKVVADIGPASAPEVLSRLLNGSRFNFLILSSPTDPNTLDRVILSTRPDGAGAAQAYRPLQPLAQVDETPQPEPPVEPQPPQAAPPPNPNPAEGRPQTIPPTDNPPD